MKILEKIKIFFIGFGSAILAFIGLCAGLLHHRRTADDTGESLERAADEAGRAQETVNELTEGTRQQQDILDQIRKQTCNH